MEWLASHLVTLTNMGLCCFEAFMFWDVGKSFLKLRFKNYWENFLILAGLILIRQILTAREGPTTVFIAFLSGYFICSIILFSDYILWKSIYVIFFAVVQCVSELIFYIAAFGIGIQDIGPESAWQYVIFGLISKLVAFLILVVVAKGFSPGQIGQLPWKTFFAYSIMPVASFFILFFTMSFPPGNGESNTMSAGLVVSSVAVLTANAVLLHIFEGYAENMEIKRQAELSEQKASLEAKHYEQLEKINQESSQHMHDVKHILQSANLLLGSGEIEQAQKVLSNVHENMVHTEQERYCRHSIINAVLCSKQEVARAYGIQYQVEVEPVIDSGVLRPEDLIVVLGNLLDNAIEAASELQRNGFIRVFIKMRNRGTFLSISVENNYREEPERSGNRLITRKRKNETHGWGLRSISRIVKSCNGMENIFYENKVFIHQVVLGTRR
ncbi:MAG: GHKL domain-containing protein [Lachnospiraceae bacterium]|nr:GHKL domain-containing protein [Lachnospiraceae bacterium]